jgi:anti-anti-sigma factor
MLKVAVVHRGDNALVRCSGRMTVRDRHMLDLGLTLSNGTRTVILDLAEVKGMDAGGLGMLLKLRARLTEAGVGLKLMNVPRGVEVLLKLTRLNSVFEVCRLPEMLDMLCPVDAVTFAESEPLRRLRRETSAA